MLLREFPDLSWLKQQASSRFQARKGWDGKLLPNDGWPTVLLSVQSAQTYRDNINGPFSLFGNLSGASCVTVERRRQRVDDDHFFITNSGQTYTFEIEKKEPATTFNIHFGKSFVNSLVRDLESTGISLKTEAEISLPSFAFHNRLIRKTPEVKRLVALLGNNEDSLREDELLAALFTLVYCEEKSIKQSSRYIKSANQATRTEALRRIVLSIDYIHSYYFNSLSLDEVAAAGYLSKFHFLRLFKAVTRKTPHQYITEVRMAKAKELLSEHRYEVATIASQVGFANASSFSRLFFARTGVYPTQFNG